MWEKQNKKLHRKRKILKMAEKFKKNEGQVSKKELENSRKAIVCRNCSETGHYEIRITISTTNEST